MGEVGIGFILIGFVIVVKFIVDLGDVDVDKNVLVEKVYVVCFYLNVICGNVEVIFEVV